MKAIILSAGYATRLYPLNKSKGLINVGGKPMINYIIEQLEDIDEIKEAVIVTNHKFYQSFLNWSNTYLGRIKLKVLDDKTESNSDRLGAIGDIQFAIEQENINEDIWVLACDNFFTFKLKDFYLFYKNKNADCLLSQAFPDNKLEYLGKNFAVATLDKNNKILSVFEKPGCIPKSNIGLWATYIYTLDTVRKIKKYLDEGNPKDAPGNLPVWLCKQKDIFAYMVQNPCYDIGTLDVLHKINKDLHPTKKILLTGGLGYIGSHTAVELLNIGYEIVIIDNLSNSKIEVKEKIEQITGKSFNFYQADLCDLDSLYEIFATENIGAVIHFAGYKAVGESCEKPLLYYQNNLISSINLLNVMKRFDVKDLVFSSSACVYGNPDSVPVDETSECHPTNPYGRTKYMIEKILEDFYLADISNRFIILRYFNPIGAHKSGLIGENCNGIPNNLMPYITQVATGKLDHLSIYGCNYNTKDGTGIRDYIHVVDLAKGHIKALERLEKTKGIYDVYNLGTGTGYSVLEIVNTFNNICGNKIKYEFVDRRNGDIEKCFANVKKAEKELNWKAKKTLKEMCEDSYNFQIKYDKDKLE